MAQPLCTVTVGRRPPAASPVRLAAIGTRHPWASFDDLASMAEWDEDTRQDRWNHMHRGVPDMVHETPDGTLLIAAPMVGGVFQAWVWIGCEAAQTLLEDASIPTGVAEGGPNGGASECADSAWCNGDAVIAFG